jgi:hypothetical protein
LVVLGEAAVVSLVVLVEAAFVSLVFWVVLGEAVVVWVVLDEAVVFLLVLLGWLYQKKCLHSLPNRKRYHIYYRPKSEGLGLRRNISQPEHGFPPSKSFGLGRPSPKDFVVAPARNRRLLRAAQVRRTWAAAVCR